MVFHHLVLPVIKHKECVEDIQGSEFSTGGNYSPGMSSSGTINNQADSDCKTEDDVGGRHINPTVVTKTYSTKEIRLKFHTIFNHSFHKRYIMIKYITLVLFFFDNPSLHTNHMLCNCVFLYKLIRTDKKKKLYINYLFYEEYIVYFSTVYEKSSRKQSTTRKNASSSLYKQLFIFQ